MGQGIGTASLKVKLLQKLTVTRGEILYEILIDLKKTYDTLERDR